MANSIHKSLFKIIITGTLSFIPLTVFSQNIVGSSRNGSSLGLNPQPADNGKSDGTNKTVSSSLGMLTLSTAEKKAELNFYNYFVKENFTHFYVGISAGAEIKNSIATIFKNNDLVSGGNANLRIGFRVFSNHRKVDPPASTDPEIIEDYLKNNAPKAHDLWLVANAGFTGSSFKLFYPDSAFSKQIQKQNFSAGEFNLGFNYWNPNIYNNTVLAGLTIGIKNKNNFDDLIEQTREDTKTIIDTTTSTNRKIVLKETVYTGAYKEEIIFPLNFDVYFVPHKLENNVGFLLNTTNEVSTKSLPNTKIGFGVFALDHKAFNPVAGIVFGYNDVFNNDKTDDYKGNLKKFTVSISTRINILNNSRRAAK